ncbi:hypothetical protein OE88DRAFT_1682635 [Heliocybe sulcata]|uniref:THUMP domain-containing protein n=1 Tax=Heliocybe sulcata TaxID=5364 RepID=A0A5C3MVQ9_9AGAM|nr:hypothetical protein OE88DRAFT_1682635 [Heliocybe sulcata]
MADKGKSSRGGDKRRRYRSVRSNVTCSSGHILILHCQDGTPIWGKRSIDGPGVWVTCVKGKERQTVGELYDLFSALAEEMWPERGEKDGDGMDQEEEDLEAQIAREVAAMKKPRKEQMFANCKTDTPCVIFISCKPPVDPVAMVLKYVNDVVHTGITRTKYSQRLTPVSGSCVANTPEICGLFKKVVLPFFENADDKKYTYKIELRSRNHHTIARDPLLAELAALVPATHKVDLKNPEVFILVELFKSVCGMSVVRDYYRLMKFNVMEIAGAKQEGEGRDGDVRMN